jgi:iron complex transport system substrate-binding protein
VRELIRKTPVILITIILVSVVACSIAFGVKGKQIYPFTMKDGWGYKIKFVSPPKRIISCMPSITEILYKLDLEDEIVGVTEHCNFPEEAEEKDKVGRDKMNLEKVVSLKPDLIIMFGDAQSADIKRFKSFGLPVFVINPETVDEVMYSITLLGKAGNRPHAAYALTEKIERKLKWTAVRIKDSEKPKPKVFVEVWHKPLITAANKTFLNDVIERAGGINVAKWAKGKYPEYSFEKLIAADPDVIIIPKQNVPSEDSIYNDSRWNELRAVKNRRVLFIDADLMSRPGPRIAYAVEEIATFLYEWDKEKEDEG